MPICPTCGQAFPENIKVNDELLHGDFQFVEAVEEFVKKMGIRGAAQTKFLKELRSRSTRGVMSAIKAWEQGGYYTKLDNNGKRYGTGYFLAIAKNKDEKIRTEETAKGGLPPSYNPEEYE